MLPNIVFLDPSCKESSAWQVLFAGNIEPPQFNSKGAAQAYLDMLERGQRLPEYT